MVSLYLLKIMFNIRIVRPCRRIEGSGNMLDALCSLKEGLFRGLTLESVFRPFVVVVILLSSVFVRLNYVQDVPIIR